MTPQVKTCFKCGKELPIDEFYRHSQMKDGHLNKCKVCARRDVRENRTKKVEYYREYDHLRQYMETRKQWLLEHQRKVRALHRDKYKCRSAVQNALRSHRLIKQPCEICGAMENVQAHHEDYSKPLDVIWLCFKHHRWIHS